MPASEPVFIAHQGRQRPDVLREFLVRAHTTHLVWRVASTVCLPRYKQNTALKMLRDLNPFSSFALGDPETHRLAATFNARGRGRDDFQYLKESNPYANRERFVRDVLQAQIDVDRDVLITPWLLHGSSPTRDELVVTGAMASDAVSSSLADGRRLLIGAAVTEGVLKGRASLHDFINDAVEWPDRPLYLRVQTKPVPGRQGYQDEDGLLGLRRTVESLTANERRILLPQTGLVGWLMMAFGASGFGSGIDGSWERFLPPSSGGGPAAPLHWYFVPQLLGFVQARELEQIRARVASFHECDCPYCDDPMRDRSWTAERAGKHYLWWCAQLANEMPDEIGDRQAVIGTRLSDAVAFWNDVQRSGVTLDPRSEATHLEVWSRAMA